METIFMKKSMLISAILCRGCAFVCRTRKVKTGEIGGKGWPRLAWFEAAGY